MWRHARFLWLFVVACSFHPSEQSTGRDGAALDSAHSDSTRSDSAHVDSAPVDAPKQPPPANVYVPPNLCAADPTLPFCLTFDQATYGSNLSNEGSASDLRVALHDVTRTGGGSAGGAALLGSDSTMILPPTTELPTNLTMAMWLRIDKDPDSPVSDPTAGSGDGSGSGAFFRDGLLDGASSASGTSLFLYLINGDPELRCVLTSATLFSPPLAFTPGTWHYAACSCDPSTQVLSLYFDGSLASTLTPCGSGELDDNGVTIGQDSNGFGQPTDDPFVGAIDGLRLWNVSRTADQICATSGRATCD